MGATSDALTPWMWLLPLPTPTLPPATHTNTLIVGHDRVVVIEPATPHPGEQARLEARIEALVAEGRELVGLLLTHHHPDHIGHAHALRRRFDVPLMAHPATVDRLPALAIDRTLDEGDRIELGDGVAIEAMFTPGHAPGHLVYRELRSGIAHAGDMVAGIGTIVIDPDDDGDMAQYLASLERMREVGFTALVPAHGPVIDDAERHLAHYVAHRLGREAKVLAAVAREGSASADVLASAYDDTPRALWPLAARALEAHLRKLQAEGRVVRHGDLLYRLGPSDGRDA